MLSKLASMIWLFFDVGGGEIMLIALVVLLFFGGKRLPELMKGLGKGIREFNTAKAHVEQEIRDGIKSTEDSLKVDEEPSSTSNHQQII